MLRFSTSKSAAKLKKQTTKTSFFERRLDKWRNTIVGAKVIPRKEHRDLMKAYTEENKDDPFRSALRSQEMKFDNPNAFYDKEVNKDASLGGYADNRRVREENPKSIFGWEDPFQKWWDKRYTHEEDEFMKYVEFQYRGWIKPELTRALYSLV